MVPRYFSATGKPLVRFSTMFPLSSIAMKYACNCGRASTNRIPSSSPITISAVAYASAVIVSFAITDTLSREFCAG